MVLQGVLGKGVWGVFLVESSFRLLESIFSKQWLTSATSEYEVFEEFLPGAVHCDWTIDVKSTLGVECKGSTGVGSPATAESDTVAAILANVRITTHGLDKSTIHIRQNKGKSVEICCG